MKTMLSYECVNMYIIIIIIIIICKIQGLSLASNWLNFMKKYVHSGV